jgi:hypothetical protein
MELTLEVSEPTAVLTEAMEDWSDETEVWMDVNALPNDATLLLSDATLVVSPATDLPILVTLVPMPVSPVLIVWEFARALLTVKEPMFEAAYPEVLLLTCAPTRYAPLTAEAGKATLKAYT